MIGRWCGSILGVSEGDFCLWVASAGYLVMGE